MNIYGDRGNVIALQRRAEWRGIETRVHEIGIGDPIPADIDVFFFGGGQDQQQVAVARDLQGAKGEAIKAAIEAGRIACCRSAADTSCSVTSTARTRRSRCPGSASSIWSRWPGRSGSSATS